MPPYLLLFNYICKLLLLDLLLDYWVIVWVDTIRKLLFGGELIIINLIYIGLLSNVVRRNY
mgnify:CR=1 FL=1